MSALKDLENITDAERASLKELLLERVMELQDKKELLEEGPLPVDYSTRSRITEIEKLIKFNTYLYHWVERPPTMRLQ